jgi:hypothetical protein
MIDRKPFAQRDDSDAQIIVNEALANAQSIPKPSVADLIEEIEAEIDRRTSSAHVWTRDGYDCTGVEWTRRMGLLMAIARLLKFVAAHEREIAKAVKK